MRTLGRPSTTRNGLIDYGFRAPNPHCPTCEGIFGDLAFRFENGRMNALEIRRISMGG